MDDTTVDERFDAAIAEWQAQMDLEDRVSDQRLRYIMANPDVKIGSFRPVDSMTKDELLAELNSDESKNAR
jgi:hypothetical protein